MRPLSSLRHLAAPALTALALVALLLPLIAGAATAKEGMSAFLDAPIALDSAPGTELLVGLTVTVLTDDGEHPVDGSPIVLILTGRDGETTEARGMQDRIGHYVARATVPATGVRGLRVVLRGTTDIDVYLLEDPFIFGGVTARTAQVAPAPTPGLTPFPRATAVAAAPVAAAPVPVNPAPASEGIAWWPAALVAIALGLAVIVAVRMRVARRAAQGT